MEWNGTEEQYLRPDTVRLANQRSQLLDSQTAQYVPISQCLSESWQAEGETAVRFGRSSCTSCSCIYGWPVSVSVQITHVYDMSTIFCFFPVPIPLQLLFSLPPPSRNH